MTATPAAAAGTTKDPRSWPKWLIAIVIIGSLVALGYLAYTRFFSKVFGGLGDLVATTTKEATFTVQGVARGTNALLVPLVCLGNPKMCDMARKKQCWLPQGKSSTDATEEPDGVEVDGATVHLYNGRVKYTFADGLVQECPQFTGPATQKKYDAAAQIAVIRGLAADPAPATVRDGMVRTFDLRAGAGRKIGDVKPGMRDEVERCLLGEGSICRFKATRTWGASPVVMLTSPLIEAYKRALVLRQTLIQAAAGNKRDTVDESAMSYSRYFGMTNRGFRLSSEPFEGSTDMWGHTGATDEANLKMLVHAHHACIPALENKAPWQGPCATARGKKK